MVPGQASRMSHRIMQMNHSHSRYYKIITIWCQIENKLIESHKTTKATQIVCFQIDEFMT